jgi:hypothetical protein
VEQTLSVPPQVYARLPTGVNKTMYRVFERDGPGGDLVIGVCMWCVRATSMVVFG